MWWHHRVGWDAGLIKRGKRGSELKTRYSILLLLDHGCNVTNQSPPPFVPWVVTGWIPSNCDPQKPFLPSSFLPSSFIPSLSCFGRVSCHGSEKVTNAMCVCFSKHSEWQNEGRGGANFDTMLKSSSGARKETEDRRDKAWSRLAGSSSKFYMANSPQALKGTRKRGYTCAYDDQQGDSDLGTRDSSRLPRLCWTYWAQVPMSPSPPNTRHTNIQRPFYSNNFPPLHPVLFFPKGVFQARLIMHAHTLMHTCMHVSTHTQDGGMGFWALIRDPLASRHWMTENQLEMTWMLWVDMLYSRHGNLLTQTYISFIFCCSNTTNLKYINIYSSCYCNS